MHEKFVNPYGKQLWDELFRRAISFKLQLLNFSSSSSSRSSLITKQQQCSTDLRKRYYLTGVVGACRPSRPDPADDIIRSSFWNLPENGRDLGLRPWLAEWRCGPVTELPGEMCWNTELVELLRISGFVTIAADVVWLPGWALTDGDWKQGTTQASGLAVHCTRHRIHFTSTILPFIRLTYTHSTFHIHICLLCLAADAGYI